MQADISNNPAGGGSMARLAAESGSQELFTIYEISKILASSVELAKTMHAVLNQLAVDLDVRRSMICLIQQESGDLHLVSATGMTQQEVARGRYRIGEGVTGRIFKSGTPVVIPDVSQDETYLDRTGSLAGYEEGIAFIGVPIKAGAETLGVLSVDHDLSHGTPRFEHELRFLTMVANLIGQSVLLNRSVEAERNELLREKQRLQKELNGKYSLDNVVGISKSMQDVFAEVHQSAPSRSTVLLRGESGVGKEVIARAVHYLSPRKDGPFIKVNCAALSETLLESELFGHERGAFTGAQAERKGRFELANGGTLFLDEIGDISAAFQAKLLRVLQEREFERVGGSRSIKVDVRLITATNVDLEKAVADGDFRADLYFRINVVSIFIPSLRERREDIPYLIDHFLEKFNHDNNRKISISPEAVAIMTNCYWPGNVRELENCVERTATMTHGNVIKEVHIPCQQNKCMSHLLHSGDGHTQAHAHHDPQVANVVFHRTPPAVTAAATTPAPAEERPAAMPPRGMSERERLIATMEQCGWVQARAARQLNLTPRQIGYALQKYNIEIKKF